MDYSPGFSAKICNFDFGPKIISSERASQEEQNGTNVSFIAPSSEELCSQRYLIETTDYSPGVSSENRWNLVRLKRIPCKSISQGEQNGANFSWKQLPARSKRAGHNDKLLRKRLRTQEVNV